MDSKFQPSSPGATLSRARTSFQNNDLLKYSGIQPITFSERQYVLA